MLLALSMMGSPASLATMKELNRPDTVAVTISVLNTVVYVGVGVLGKCCRSNPRRIHRSGGGDRTRIVYPYSRVCHALRLPDRIGAAFHARHPLPDTGDARHTVTLEEIERELA